MDILVNVVNQKLKMATNLKSLVAGTQEFVRFVFNTGGDWDELMTFAQFMQNGVAYNQYLDDDKSAYLPAEIGVGTCTVMLYGSNESTIATTNYLTLTIDDNILVSDAQSTDISESLYNQLVTQVNSLSQKVTELENNEDIAALIESAVQTEMEEYLSSGQLAEMTIADGSISRAKVDADFEATLAKADSAASAVETISSTLLEKVDGGYLQNGYLYLTANGTVVVGPLGPFTTSSDGSGGDVISVNGYTGTVVLTADDVGALPTTGGTVNGSVTLNGTLTMGKQKGITLDGGVLSFSPSDSDGFYITKNEDYSGEAAVAFYGSDADQPVLLTNVADPEEDDNAANKLYVDGLVANAVGAYGVPNGGIEGQVLAKASGEDQDVTWVTVSASGSGSGSDGRGISGIVDYYAVSDNPITAPTQWADIPVPPTAEMKYAWHYQVITYTDGTTYTGAAHVIGVYGDPGEPGEDGADGGYYTPVATQPDSNTLRLSYTPSDDTMPAVDPVDIALPGGSTLPFYTCSSSASSATKTLTGDQELPTDSGTLFAVNFAFANTSSAPVLVHDDTSLTVIRAGQSQSFSAQNLDAGVHLFLVLSGAYALLLNPNYGM